MSELSELSILFHAWGLESRYFSTKLCSIVKSFSENICTKEELMGNLPLPSEMYWQQARDEIAEAKDLGLSCISILDPAYPSRLSEIDDPPMILFVLGGVLDAPFNAIKKCYAIVGARRPTIYGESVAKGLGRGLSNLGITVVSGLAMGIDTRAHQGGIVGDAELPTIAVLGSGILRVSPSFNRGLVEEIVQRGGLVVSEYGLRETSRPHLFPRRNRIISGLSSSVVIVEAEERSGSLITSRLALEQNRDVYSVPGPIDSSLSRGTNKLIYHGATIVLSVKEFLSEVKDKEGICESKIESLSSTIEVIGDNEKRVVELIANGVLSFQEILDQLKLPQSEVRLALTNLLLKDVLVERDGLYYKERVE